MYLLLAVGILLVAGYLGYTQLVPKSTTGSSAVTVEKVGVIPSDMDSAGTDRINDTAKVIDYNLPVDLTGLGNQAPFGQ
jgi:hypothetical protein